MDARVLGLTAGELFIVVFVTVVVISAPWWLRLGEIIATTLAGSSDGDSEDERPSSAGDE